MGRTAKRDRRAWGPRGRGEAWRSPRQPHVTRTESFSQEATYRSDVFGKSEAVARDTELADPARSTDETAGAPRNEAAPAVRSLRLVVLGLYLSSTKTPHRALRVVESRRTPV